MIIVWLLNLLVSCLNHTVFSLRNLSDSFPEESLIRKFLDGFHDIVTICFLNLEAVVESKFPHLHGKIDWECGLEHCDMKEEEDKSAESPKRNRKLRHLFTKTRQKVKTFLKRSAKGENGKQGDEGEKCAPIEDQANAFAAGLAEKGHADDDDDQNDESADRREEYKSAAIDGNNENYGSAESGSSSGSSGAGGGAVAGGAGAGGGGAGGAGAGGGGAGGAASGSNKKPKLLLGKILRPKSKIN